MEFKGLKIAHLNQEEIFQLENGKIQIEPEDPPSFKRVRLLSLEEKSIKCMDNQQSNNDLDELELLKK